MKTLVALIAVSLLVGSEAFALDEPKGAVVLTVKGSIELANRDSVAVFDRDMLEALPGRTASMETPWTTGKVEFSGPYLRSVLEAVGAHGSRLIVRASIRSSPAACPANPWRCATKGR